MKRLLSGLLTLALLLTLVTLPAAAEDRPTLTIAVKEDLAVSDWKDNYMTKYIEDKLNVNLEFVVLPSKEIGTKLNLMAMDGGKDLPDILFYAANDTEIMNWAEMGVIVPLTKYYDDEKLSANIREAWTRIGVDYRGQITSPDGEIYTIPSFNQSYGNEQPAKIFLYKPFLDALNLQVPTTTDELYEVLKAVVNGDPNGNGKKDEIGIAGSQLGNSIVTTSSGWFEALMNAFVYAGDSNYLVVNDGKISAAYTSDAWKEGLAYIAKLYQEGLIEDEALTQDEASFRAILNSEEPVVFMRMWLTAVGALDGASDRKLDYVGIMPIKGPEGVQYASYRPSVASARMLVTKNCKNPELAFQLGDLMSSEYLSIVTRWGQEGIDWDYISNMSNPSDYDGMYEAVGFEKYIVCYDDAAFWSAGTPQNRAYRQQGPYVRQYAIANGQAKKKGTLSEDVLRLAQLQYDLQNGGYNPTEVIPKLIYNSEESDQISEISTNLLTYVHEYCAAVIDGQMVLDDSWEDFKQEIQMIGLDTYLDVTQKVYDRMYK